MISRVPASFSDCNTLVDLLRWRAVNQPDQRAYAFLYDEDPSPTSLTYLELDRRARAVAAWLQQRAAPGDRILVLHPPGTDYVSAVFGCLYAGTIAVPAYPPVLDRTLPRVQAIAADAQARAVLAPQALRVSLAPQLGSEARAPLPWQGAGEIDGALASSWKFPTIEAGTLALLQYTSGSTGTPKGVMLEHAHVLRNMAVLGLHAEGLPLGAEPAPLALDCDRYSDGVCWLPPYHDMGLIGGVLAPPYSGRPTTFMSPLAFLQRPFRWLDAISRTRARYSGAPNFAYDLCVRRISEAERAHLDLSGWEVAVCGAEPVRAETLEAFAKAFAPCGFRREAFSPCYGLAEATLLVTATPRTSSPTCRRFDAAALERNRAEPGSSDDRPARTLVSSGRPDGGVQLRIVDPAGLHPVAMGRVGEIWVASTSVARGYWNRPDESRDLFGARLPDEPERRFLRTGDLGFLLDGELYVTGRLRDLIIVRGENHHPSDIERTVEASHPELRSNAGAVFGVDAGGEERVVVVQEVSRPRSLDAAATIAAILAAVTQTHGLTPFAIALLRPGGVPKTSSGKIQRYACREAFLARALPVLAQWPPDPASPRRRPETEPYAPPNGALELRIADVWKDVLSLERVSIDESFFDLGGHSVLLLQLHHRLEAAFDRRIPLLLLFEHPTIRALAAALECNARDASSDREPTLHAAEARAARRLQALDAGAAGRRRAFHRREEAR